MKRFYAAVFATLFALAVTSAPAEAVLRVPQIAYAGSILQVRFNLQGEHINVYTDQQEGLVWSSTGVSGNSMLTIQFDFGGNVSGTEMGIAALDATGKSVTGLAPVFPATADNGWFAVASFRPGDKLVVNLFNPTAQLVDTKTYFGVKQSLFGYYIKANSHTFYSHEGFNSDGKSHAMTFAGTGQNTGCWWQCWENAPISDYSAADFDDAIVFMESLNPTPVSHTTWGRVKARFR